ncbi:efflux RND transporter periplasmic adaptor subunit [Ferrimonas lipolytica]|uniref:Efflux RND transporter periplasmic adaptor subunit n=1 Tax=Ferrimonas lipolytica TaxID=2724191 RepID=A0A6H1UHE6_9GAMM|nr:efflux RND transporter periplasmic adaptor subunit [Ferrimonas lipolytica]QIZ78049.1 efflux RND transporter periplasmic adaptor subunit [Ferrimonas lipolytica]
MFKRIMLVLGIVLIVLVMLGAVKYQQIKESMAHFDNFTPPPVTVSAVPVEQVEWRPMIATVGSLHSIEDIEVAAEVSGIVESIQFESGQKVEAGQLLLTLNDEVEQANLESYLAQAELAQIKYQRNANLFKKKNVSETDLDQASADLKVANAMVAQTRATIAKKNIKAPFTGTLGIRQFSLGEFIDNGQALVTLQDSRILYADFAVPEQYFPSLYQGQDVQFTVSAVPAKTFTGKVIAIESKIDEATRNIEIRAQLPNLSGELHPGMYADIRLLMKEMTSPLVVPSTAIAFSPFGDAVFEVLKNDAGEQIVKRRYVEVGERRGDQVAILSGLESTALVVNAGITKLENDTKVTLSDAVKL